MITLTELKKDREGMSSLHEVIDILKGASSMQLRILQQKKGDDSFIKLLEDFFRILNLQYIVHPFLRESPTPHRAIVLVTSDESFTGELNSLVIEEAFKKYEEGDELIVLGTRGRVLLEGSGVKFSSFGEALDEKTFFPLAKSLVKYIVDKYLKQKIGRLDFIYPRFISLSKQVIVSLNLLPFHPMKIIKGIKPPSEEAVIEPSLYRVADILVRLWMVQRIHDLLWEARVAHTAARILQLEGSSQELTKIEENLRFQYYKLLHRINDMRIREIFASRLKKGS